MPIIGLTTNVRPAFPSLGKLRKGGPKPKTGNKPGPDLEYFRFTSDDPQIEAAFYAAYPEKPQSLNVFLPNKGIDDNWACWKEHWVAGGLVHRCDGETCITWQDNLGEYQETPEPCPGGCTPVGRLQVMLPELLAEGYVGGVTVETHSKNDILSIQACLESAAANSKDADGEPELRGIEFRLYRVSQKISTPMPDKRTGEMKRVRRAKWLVKLTPTARWVQAQLAQAEHLQLAMPEALALPEPEDEDIEDGEFTEEEPKSQLPDSLDDIVSMRQGGDGGIELIIEHGLPAHWTNKLDPDAVMTSLMALLGRHGIETLDEAAKIAQEVLFQDYMGSMIEFKQALEAHAASRLL